MVLKVRLRSPLTWFVLALIASTVVGTATVRWRSSPTRAETSAGVLLDLHSPAELHARFNADTGNARLVLLLSPT